MLLLRFLNDFTFFARNPFSRNTFHKICLFYFSTSGEDILSLFPCYLHKNMGSLCGLPIQNIILMITCYLMLPVLLLPSVGLSIRLTVGFVFRPSTCSFKPSSTIFNFHTKQSGYTIISFTKASITSSGIL